MQKGGDHGSLRACHAETEAGNERALKISAWLTGIYFLIELAIGLYSGSVAVISDEFHTFSAVGGVVLSSRRASPAGRQISTAPSAIIAPRSSARS